MSKDGGGGCCCGNKTPPRASNPGADYSNFKKASRAQEIFRLTEFVSSVGIQGSYSTSRRTLYVSDQNKSERRIIAYHFSGKDLKKSFTSVLEKEKRPVYVAADGHGNNVYAHIDAKEGNSIWRIENDMLSLKEKVDTSKLDAPKGGTKWALAADSSWLLVLVSEPVTAKGKLHKYKNLKYLGCDEIKYGGDKMELRAGYLVIGNSAKRAVYVFKFTPNDGTVKEAYVDPNVFNGDVAMLGSGVVVTVNPSSFMLTGTKAHSPKTKGQQKLLKTLAPVCGMDGEMFCAWDRTHREIIVMKL